MAWDRLNGRAAVGFIPSAMSGLMSLWVINTGGLRLIAGVGIMKRLVRSRGELLAVSLAAAMFGLAAADGEHPEEPGAEGEGACKPGEGEEGGLHFGVHVIGFRGGDDGGNDDGAGCGGHCGRADYGRGCEPGHDVGDAGAAARAEAEKTGYQGQDGEDQGNGVDDLCPFGDCDESVQCAGDFLWEGCVLAGGTLADCCRLLIHICGVDGLVRPVELGLGASVGAVGGIAVVP